jgi:hypothetical protein
MDITQNEEKETMVIFIELQQCKQYVKEGVTQFATSFTKLNNLFVKDNV